MRILLEESLPRRVERQLPAEHLISTVQEQGWGGKRNGELLRLAERQFDVFVTMDRGLEY